MKNFNKGMKNCLGMLIGFLLLPAMLSGQQCDQLDMDLTPTNWTTDANLPNTPPFTNVIPDICLTPQSSTECVVGVELCVYGKVTGAAGFESLDFSTTTVNLIWGAELTVYFDGTDICTLNPGTTITETVTPPIPGIPGDGDFDFDGPMGSTYTNLEGEDVCQTIIDDPALLASFLNGGTACIDALAVGNSQASGSGNIFSFFQTNAGIGISQTNTLTFSVSEAKVQPTCNGGSDGSIMLTVTDNFGANPDDFSYSWTGPNGFTATTKDISGIPAGSYMVDVSYTNPTTNNTNSCSYTFNLGEPSVVTCHVTNVTDIDCFGNANGSITVSGAGGTGSGYTYSLSAAGPFTSNNTFNNLAPGSYTIYVKDSNGCDAPNPCTTTISEPSALGCNFISSHDPDCFGDTNGSLKVSGTGGTPWSSGNAYRYRLDGTNYLGNTVAIPVNTNNFINNNGNFNGLAAGSYTVTVRDNNDCTVACATITLGQPDELTASCSATDAICVGVNTGTITVTASGGTGALSYQLDNGSFQSGNTFSSLSAGTYTVTVKDQNDCTTTCTAIVNNANSIILNSSSTPVSCLSPTDDGTITATATGGTAPYTYSIPGQPDNNDGQFTNLAQGQYTVTVTDVNGCIAIDQVTVQADGASWDHVNLGSNLSSCDGTCDGSIIVDANFNLTGEFRIEYTFEGNVVQVPGTFTQSDDITLDGLCEGTYSEITIIGVNTGCESVWPEDITISEPESPAITVSNNEVICEGESVILSASTDGGADPITIIWMPGNLTGTSVAVSPGVTTTYTATATDNNGCTDSDQVTVTVNPVPSVNAGSDQTICEGGSVTLSASGSGGTGPYSYAWDNGLGAGASQTFTPTLSGYANETITYTVTVTDENGCTATDEVLVTVLSIPDVIVSSTNPTCGDDNGTITFTFDDHPDRTTIEFSLDGGANYTVSSPDNAISVTVPNLDAITYDLWVRWDGGECPVDLPDVTLVDEPGPTVTASDDDVICAGETVSLSATASGGTGTITYTWTPGNLDGANVDVNPTVTTTYTVTVEDENECTDTDEVIVTVNPTPIVDAGSDQTICEGGSVTLNANGSGGTPPLNYAWDNGLGAGASQTFTPTLSGYANQTFTYIVTVTDNNGCTATDEVSVTVLSTPVVTVSSTNPTCGADNGTITFTFDDHPDRSTIEFSLDGELNYTLVSLDDAGSVTILDLDAGTYDLWVRWGNEECPVDLPDVTLNDELGPSVTASGEATICVGATVSLSAMASGGTGTITYTWMPGNLNGANVDVSPTVTTTYTVTVEDENECTASETVEVTVVDDPMVTISANGSDICEGGSVMLTATTSGGLDCQDVQWQRRLSGTSTWSNVGTGDTYTTDTGLVPDMYDYRAQYICSGNGCDDDNSNIITINVVEDPNISISIEDDVICENNETTTLSATTSGGLDCAAVQWQFREGTSGSWTDVGTGTDLETDVNLNAGTYQYRAIYACGGTDCNDATSTTVTLTVTAVGSISNFVFEDVDADGIQDVLEMGVDNVTVNLLDENGNQVATTTTTGGGFYIFENICAGSYIVEFTTPTGFIFTSANEGTDDTVDSDANETTGQTSVIVLSPGENDDTVDAGIYRTTVLGDFVWEDLNADGIQDAGEPGIENVTVTLLDDNGNTVGSTTTDGTGFYEFTGVVPGDYVVVFGTPSGYEATPANQGGDDELDSDAVGGQTGTINLESGENDLTNDAGFYRFAAIGNFVWEDLNADGIQDAGEPGIENVTVTLQDDNGNVLNTTTTDASGFYEFTNLVPGDYIVVFGTPAGFEPTPANQGGDDDLDSDAVGGQTGVINIESGEVDNSNDAGYYETAALGNYAWFDRNNDGVQGVLEDGITPEIAAPGVVINLYQADGTFVSTTTTAADGTYAFTNLVPGVYYIESTGRPPYGVTVLDSGSDDELDSDIDPNTFRSENITLESGEVDNSWDVGVYRPPMGEISDPCICLNNATNSINGQFKDVLDIVGNPGDVWTITAQNGMYLTSSLMPPASPTPVPVGTLIPGVGDPLDGLFSFEFLHIDAIGYDVLLVSNGIETFDFDNLCEYPEIQMNDFPAELCLYDDPITLTATSNQPGTFEFFLVDVNAGTTTQISIITPIDLGAGSYQLITNFIPDNPMECINTMIDDFVITITDDCLASLGDFVWEDIDGDGIQDASEPGIENVPVLLY
jgi:protocatechuate 3,4-dioxygenase beta subunit